MMKKVILAVGIVLMSGACLAAEQWKPRLALQLYSFRDRSFTDPGHQNTVHRISPPTLASRASWSAMTPFGVDTIVTPSPLLMRGMFLTEV